MEITKNKVQSHNDRYKRVRVETDVYDKIARVAEKTNMTLNEITSELLRYSIGKLKLRTEYVPVLRAYIADDEEYEEI